MVRRVVSYFWLHWMEPSLWPSCLRRKALFHHGDPFIYRGGGCRGAGERREVKGRSYWKSDPPPKKQKKKEVTFQQPKDPRLGLNEKEAPGLGASLHRIRFRCVTASAPAYVSCKCSARRQLVYHALTPTCSKHCTCFFSPPFFFVEPKTNRSSKILSAEPNITHDNQDR